MLRYHRIHLASQSHNNELVLAGSLHVHFCGVTAAIVRISSQLCTGVTGLCSAAIGFLPS